MKNTRAIFMLVIAMVAGLAAVVLASRWISQQALAGGSQVAVAAVDVDLGGRVTPDMVRLVDWPSSSIPDGAFSDPKVLDGRVVKNAIQRGEPILEAKLAPVGTKGGLSAVVPEGKRAMTVRVNDVIGVAGFALPGNFVDIIVSTQEDATGAGNNKDRTISKIVLDRILVLAVAQEANRDETKPKVVNAVTLEVTPDQAEKLDLARSVGTLSLVLRNQVDLLLAQTEGATKSSLLGDQPEPEPVKAEPPKPEPIKVSAAPAKPKAKRAVLAIAPAPARDCVEVIRGLTKVIECF